MSVKTIFSKLALIMAVSSAPVLLNGCVTALVGATAAGTGTVVGSDSRTVDKMVDDENIERQAMDIVMPYQDTYEHKQSCNIDVVSVNGNVLIVGQTTRQDDLDSIIGRIKNIKNVRKVYNYVQNKPPVSAAVTARDTLITSEVKSALLFGKQISSGRFKVYTEDSNVYLLGYVTRDEAQRAINQTKKVGGINKIYTIFDYMNAIPSPSSVEVVDGDIANKSNANYGTRNSSSMAEETQATVDNGGASIVEDDSDLLAPSKPAANW